MQTKLIFLRHGQSQSNVNHLITGYADVPLTEIGKKQARLVCNYLRNEHINVIYSSDLSRAVDTVLPTAETHNLQIIKDERLREINMGSWESKSLHELYQTATASKIGTNNPFGFEAPSDGEQYTEFAKRVINAITDIAENNQGKTVLISTHGGAICAFECSANNVGIDAFGSYPNVPNASVTYYSYENGKFSLIERAVHWYLGKLVTNLPTK